MIEKFFTTTFEVNRAVWKTDESLNQYSELSTVGTFLGHLQQASAFLAENLGLNMTKTFTIWCPVDTDVLEGDSIETYEAIYTVRAIQKNNTGVNTHLEIVVELDQEISQYSIS
jgi:hypothetical protein